jgi:hypothetical protein
MIKPSRIGKETPSPPPTGEVSFRKKFLIFILRRKYEKTTLLSKRISGHYKKMPSDLSEKIGGTATF